MDQLQKFLFEGLPVRGMLVRLEDGWRDLLARRQPAQGGAGEFPPAVRGLLGEMTAAAALMQASIRFEGRLILQIMGDGPVKLAVAECGSDMSFRATAKVVGEVAPGATLEAMLNVHGQGRCAITLDPQERQPGQQPYQGVVPLHGDQREPLQHVAQVLEHYMLQSEQLDTRLVLAADDRVAAGLLIQRLPVEGQGNLGGPRNEDEIGLNEAFNRIAHLAATLSRDELLRLEPAGVLHRLFWQESVRVFEPSPLRFACTCSRARVGGMLRGLGRAEVDEVLAERGDVEVGCEFCGAQYRFDAVDVGGLFTPTADQLPGSAAVN
ncbi:MAG: Hsp33 family molecular chaperone HslO [Aquabacterium sp.]